MGHPNRKSWKSIRLTCPNVIFLCVAVLSLFPSVSKCAKNKDRDSSVDRECQSIATLIKSKGFTYPWWDSRAGVSISTSTGEICPGVASAKVSKCCKDFDAAGLKNQIEERFSQKWLGDKLSSAAEIFRDRKSRFDVTFKALLSRAHASFHAMFERTYGMLYIQHAHVFHALFSTLETYYDTGRDSLESKLNEFFAILTRKMFEVLNSQYAFEESYLSCATIVISEKQGNELHRQIVSSLRRSFVATRALAQGLQDGDKVLTNLQKFRIGSDCQLPMLQLIQCPICVEQRAYKPCAPQCLSVTSKCLSSTQSIAKPWTEYINALEGIIDRLVGPYNVEAVVEPIHIKISEAIMNFQESGPELSQAVFSKCGKPKLKSSGYSKRDTSSKDQKNTPKSSNNSERSRKPQSDRANVPDGPQDGDMQPSKSLEKLLRETKNRVKKSKTLWEVLPKQVCNAISKDYSSQLCWNGTAAIKPDKNKTTEGSDPKNHIGKGSPSHLVAEQVIVLQSITDKLRASYNGQDVQWVQEILEEFDIGSGFGSGSGDMPTDMDDSDDDDPSGQIKPQWKPKQTPNRNSGPRFPSGTPPPIFNIPIDEDEEDNSRDNSVNFNVNTNSNRRPTSDIGSSNSHPGVSGGGIDFFVPQPPKVNNKPVNPPTTTTTTRRPDIVNVNNNKPTTPSKGTGDADKTVAVFKLFTPIIVSMIGKMFSFS